jgi:filamentous hemagglutinin family protein
MMKAIASSIGVIIGLGAGLAPAIGQVIPDGTLPTTVVAPNGLDFTINDGVRSGNNLFHSFQEFSVPTGGSVVFNNAIDIQNIFSRVTGSIPSNINGAIQAQGNANLFLLNPSGILFGPNASLNIGGSFIGTTATSVKFADGVEFSAANPTATPLLTMSVPIGLQMGQNPGTIQNASRLPSPFPYDAGFFVPGGLQVQPHRSLILLGGDVLFAGGAASALQGQLEVGGVGGQSFVALVPRDFGFELNYDTVQTWQDVRLDNLAVLDGRDGGVQVRGRQIEILNGSAIFADLMQETSSRGINLKASASLKAAGVANVEGSFRSFPVHVVISSSTPPESSGNGGNISLQAPEITVSEWAYVIAGVAGSGQGGQISIQADQLNVLNSGRIGTGTYGSGAAGDFTIQATDIQVSGIGEKIYGPFVPPAVIYTSTSEGTGNGGTLTLKTERLSITDGGNVAANTFGAGNAGNLIIQASDFVEIATANPNSSFPIGIIADATNLGALEFMQNLAGNGGNVELTTKRLIVRDGATITVGNPGTGDAGNLTINAESVTLNQGSLNAAIAAGKQGNISINTNVLLMRNNSRITTDAASQANGGNISINAPVIIGLENSDIVANAIQGQGGNIQITTQGVFGFKFRAQLTPENDITASSEFGINGTVQITNIGLDPNSGLVTLPVDTIDPNQQVANACGANQDSSFVITGRGGLAPSPVGQIKSNRTWSDLRDRSALSTHPQPPARAAQVPVLTPPLVEATGWRRNAKGKIELYAAQPVTATPIATCAK